MHRAYCALICNRHQCSDNHERYIQQKECEYILGINHDYVVFHYAFFFSFRRPFVHFRLIRFTEKLLLIVAYLFTQLVTIQTISFWAVTFVFALFYTIARPFRAPASNVALCLCEYTICLHALLLAMKGSDYAGQALVNSQLRFTLTVIDSVGFGLALVVFIGGGIYSGWKPMVYDPINQPRGT